MKKRTDKFERERATGFINYTHKVNWKPLMWANRRPIDSAFNTNNTTILTGNLILLQPDGKIIVGMGFLNGSNQRIGFARFKTDGSLDSFYLSGSNVELTVNHVLAIALQADGKVLIGGDFTFVGLIPRVGISRLLTLSHRQRQRFQSAADASNPAKAKAEAWAWRL